MGWFNKSNVLPVVVIKDPLTWLQSMCKSHYEAHWRHSSVHCPNLVPNDYDRENFPLASTNRTTMPIRIDYGEYSMYWDSLIHLWNDFYRQYVDVDYPRLMVRFEDLLFAPEPLVRQIASCVGRNVTEPLLYQTRSSKSHGSNTDMIHAWIKFGRGATRFQNMTAEDVRFAKQRLDPELMKLFDYEVNDVTAASAVAAVQ